MTAGTESGAVLLAIREHAGLARDDVAARVGTSPDYLGRIERGELIATTDFATRTARIVLDMTRTAAPAPVVARNRAEELLLRLRGAWATLMYLGGSAEVFDLFRDLNDESKAAGRPEVGALLFSDLFLPVQRALLVASEGVQKTAPIVEAELTEDMQKDIVELLEPLGILQDAEHPARPPQTGGA